MFRGNGKIFTPYKALLRKRGLRLFYQMDAAVRVSKLGWVGTDYKHQGLRRHAQATLQILKPRIET